MKEILFMLIIYPVRNMDSKSTPRNIERKVAKRVRHILKKIEKGYEIVISYEDGCDKYGIIRYYYCNNGFEGESWQLIECLKSALIKKKNQIINEGIVYDGIRYYIHPNLYNNNFYDKNFVKIISENDYLNLSDIKNNIVIFIKKIKEKIEKDYKSICDDKTKNSSIFIRLQESNIIGDARNILKLAPIYSYVDFVEYIKTNKSYFRTYNYIIETMNSNNFEKDRKNIGMGTELFK